MPTAVEIKQALATQRKRLKIRLWRERAYTEAWITDDEIIPVALASVPLPLPAGVIRLPTCVYCGLIIKHPDNCVMHEAIVRRGVAAGWPPKERLKIHCEENCQLLHVGKCHGRAHAEPRRMVAVQIKRYGYEHLRAWINTLPFKVPYEWHRGLSPDLTEEQLCAIIAYKLNLSDSGPWR